MENSRIEWTDHTFNPWIGCAKVSPLCTHCYAETMMATRYGRVEWGVQAARLRTSAGNWRKPLAWNRKAVREGRRHRVFCASLADFFEDRDELIPWREEVFQLIDDTPHLDWLLLTKRPEQIGRLWIPPARPADPGRPRWRANVWLGTSVGTQATAETGVPQLVAHRHLAELLFLSCEPLLEETRLPCLPEIDWVIVGGESGVKARPMQEDWVLALQRDCAAAGTAFFFKQWGGRQKGRSGRELAGQTWDEIPVPRSIRRQASRESHS